LIEWYEGDVELFNLRDDLGETTNLAEQMPEKAAGLQNLLRDWLEGVDAWMPIPNPNYDASAKMPEPPPRQKEMLLQRAKEWGLL